MLLLLAGSTETAREMIVDEFLGQHKDWKHLPLEDIQDPEDEDDVLGIRQTFMTMVACECAKEAQIQGYHIIITCPEEEMIADVYGEFSDKVTSVYLGKENECDGFDHVVDSGSKAAHTVCDDLNKIIEATPA